jgi:hypothetical protein
MTALVILHHTAITYGGPGGWFWRENETSAAPSSLLFTLFCATNQAYFMGFFFLLAGYFTPRALERKGYKAFLRDRVLRLGLPLLARRPSSLRRAFRGRRGGGAALGLPFVA